MDTKSFCELVLSTLFAIFVVMDYKLPSRFSEFISSIWGKMFLLAIVVYLARNCNPILAILSIIVAFKIVNQIVTYKYTPSESKKNNILSSFNVIHKSLEEEIVSKMKPLGAKISITPYHPVLSDNHGANEL
tara:strand:+ start:2981 stop:3376 length:396 start_codon:yes stop_codon:yes gene_type:complete